MKKNMGLADKIIRMVIAALIVVFYFTGLLSGTSAIVLGIIAVIFFVTSFMSYCPLYLPFGISTRKNTKN